MKIFLLLTLSTSLAFADFSLSIVGGNDAAPGQFPYMVSFRYVNTPWNHGCGGGIVNQRWILSAAHCFIGMPDNTVTCSVGSNRLSGGTHYTSTRVVRHPRYIPNIPPIYVSNWHDIALIKTDRPIIFTALVQPIPLGRRRILGDIPGIAAGFGAYDPSIDINFPLENLVMSENLQFMNTRILSHSECRQRANFYNNFGINYPFNVIIHPTSHICSLQPRGVGLCFGDSGSMLIANGQAVGVIVSGVRLCGQGRGAPDIYTRVSAYIDWIDRYISDMD